MVLNELHVLERHARAVGQRHAVAGFDAGVGGEGKNLTAAAGTENHGFRQEGVDLPRGEFDRHDTLTPPLVHQEFGDEPLVISGHGVVLEGSLE